MRRGFAAAAAAKPRAAPPATFEPGLKTAQWDAAARAAGGMGAAGKWPYGYLRAATASNLVGRLQDMTRTFADVVELLPRDASVVREMAATETGAASVRFVDSSAQALAWVEAQAKQTFASSAAAPTTSPRIATTLVEDEAWSDLCPTFCEEASADLVISNLSMHWLNDLPGVVKQVRRMLRPDGAFLACMLAGDTMFELRTSIMVAEQEREGGLSAHVSPMLRMGDVSGMLSAAGLQLVTVDTASITVEYDSALALTRHLWNMGESNAATARRRGVSRHTFVAAAAAYEHLYGRAADENPAKTVVPATFDVVFMIGWAPHESQAQPLKPGLIPDVSLAELGKGFKG